MPETWLDLQAGVPYARRIRVVDGKNVWSTLGAFEVRSELRGGNSTKFPLYAILSDAMTVSFDGNDIVIDLALTGEDTRGLRGGHYDVILSDTGTTDARALRVLHGRLSVNPVITGAAAPA